MIKRINENFTFVGNIKMPGAIVHFSGRDMNYNSCEQISYGGNKDGKKIRFWGKDNSLPNYREQLVGENNIVGTLIQTKRDITVGQGLFAYTKDFVSDSGKVNIIEVPIPPAAKKFFDFIDIDDYLLAAAKELFLHANVFNEFIRSEDNSEIANLLVKDCKYVRLGEQDDKGNLTMAYISGAWATRKYAKNQPTEFDKTVIDLPLYNYNEDQKQKHFILPTGDNFLNDGYYNSPTWWASKGWIELANAIVLFHQANINNGYTIRFHVKVPRDYFKTHPANDTPEAQLKAVDDERNAQEAFVKDFNDLFSGPSNTGRALFTQYNLEQAVNGKWPGIEIEPINIDLKDKALLDLFEKSNTANISAQGIHPTLANIETQGRLSSGSEIRNAFIMYLAIKTPIPRRILLKAINLVKQINKWPEDVFFGFADTEITTLDQSPTGMKSDVAVVPDTAAAE